MKKFNLFVMGGTLGLLFHGLLIMAVTWLGLSVDVNVYYVLSVVVFVIMGILTVYSNKKPVGV